MVNILKEDREIKEAIEMNSYDMSHESKCG